MPALLCVEADYMASETYECDLVYARAPDLISEQDIDDVWKRDYPAWNVENLHTEGVLEVVGEQYRFVVDTHPIMVLLRHNEKVTGYVLDENPMCYGNYRGVPWKLIKECCITLRREVFGVDSDGLF